MRTIRGLRLALLLSLIGLVSHGGDPGTAQDRSATGPGNPSDEVRVIEAYCEQLDQKVDLDRASSRLFVEVSGEDGWKELTTQRNFLHQDITATARVWVKAHAPTVVEYVFGPQSHDFQSALYYFRSDGRLAKIHSHFRLSCSGSIVTHETIYNASGYVLKHSSMMWSEVAGSPANNVPTAISREDPTPVYLQARDLPFYKLLL